MDSGKDEQLRPIIQSTAVSEHEQSIVFYSLERRIRETGGGGDSFSVTASYLHHRFIRKANERPITKCLMKAVPDNS